MRHLDNTYLSQVLVLDDERDMLALLKLECSQVRALKKKMPHASLRVCS